MIFTASGRTSLPSVRSLHMYVWSFPAEHCRKGIAWKHSGSHKKATCASCRCHGICGKKKKHPHKSLLARRIWRDANRFLWRHFVWSPSIFLIFRRRFGNPLSMKNCSPTYMIFRRVKYLLFQKYFYKIINPCLLHRGRLFTRQFWPDGTIWWVRLWRPPTIKVFEVPKWRYRI